MGQVLDIYCLECLWVVEVIDNSGYIESQVG